MPTVPLSTVTFGIQTNAILATGYIFVDVAPVYLIILCLINPSVIITTTSRSIWSRSNVLLILINTIGKETLMLKHDPTRPNWQENTTINGVFRAGQYSPWIVSLQSIFRNCRSQSLRRSQSDAAFWFSRKADLRHNWIGSPAAGSALSSPHKELNSILQYWLSLSCITFPVIFVSLYNVEPLCIRSLKVSSDLWFY